MYKFIYEKVCKSIIDNSSDLSLYINCYSNHWWYERVWSLNWSCWNYSFGRINWCDKGNLEETKK